MVVGSRILNFYPRSPCGERRLEFCDTAQHIYFYPRSPCGERPAFDVLAVSALLISIHALLAESDLLNNEAVSITASFLSTLSLRRATIYPSQCRTFANDFYPRSPCGERPSFAGLCKTNFPFLSTLSLRRATLILPSRFTASAFLSTLSLRRATAVCNQLLFDTLISIHALLAESDQSRSRKTGRLLPFLSTLSLRRATPRCHDHRPDVGYFYPRSPCGERLTSMLLWRRQKLFLSTLSLRRATYWSPPACRCRADFYPRSPCGERHYLLQAA